MADYDDIESLLYQPGKSLGAMAAGGYDDSDDDDGGDDAGGDGDEDDPRDTIKRKVTTPGRGSDGLCKQPDYESMSDEDRAEREVYENHQRLRAAHQLDYADPWTGNTRTFDPRGNYVCGDCNQEDNSKCLVVVQSDGKTQIKVDLKAGSCAKYEKPCAGDPEAKMSYLPIGFAGYAIAANGVGWGCARCNKQEIAAIPDSVGRGIYCMVIDARVLRNTCCNANGLKEVPIDADGNQKSARS